MSDNIFTFPGLSPKRARTNPVFSEPQEEARNGPNMHTFLSTT
jgi:hypothetical protein